MHEQRPAGPPARPPTVAPPPPFRERRSVHRRTEDRVAHDERALLARALDVLAAAGSPEDRLAGLLDLVAETAGAARAAVLADRPERRVAVVADAGDDVPAAEALGAWLDASAGRSRAERAAAGRAPIAVVSRAGPRERPGGGARLRPAAAERPARGATAATRDGRDAADGEPAVVDDVGGRSFALLPIPSAGRVFLGFDFARHEDAASVAERLSPQLARHVAVALALATEQVATDRELVALRGRETERSRFVSTVAHELRTPLTGLRGYLDLLHDGRVGDPAVGRDFIERSRAIVDSMADLVGDLLELSQLESGTIAIGAEPFSVADAASHAASSVMPIALERATRLTTSLPPRLRAATGDRRRVEQILTNLAANALKFTPAGGTVALVGRFDGPTAIFVVRDDGPGIAAADRTRIFERFQRLPGHESITGTGLGLSIARDLARRMGGDLDVAAVAGAGSSFVLALPGPASVDRAVVAAAMRRALGEEQARLEEAALLRKLTRNRPPAAAPAPGAAAEPPADDRRPAARVRAPAEQRAADPARAG